jgi:hypothetical protein
MGRAFKRCQFTTRDTKKTQKSQISVNFVFPVWPSCTGLGFHSLIRPEHRHGVIENLCFTMPPRTSSIVKLSPHPREFTFSRFHSLVTVGPRVAFRVVVRCAEELRDLQTACRGIQAQSGRQSLITKTFISINPTLAAQRKPFMTLPGMRCMEF